MQAHQLALQAYVAQVPARAGGIYHHGIAGDEGQAQVVAHELLAAALEADFYDIEPRERVRHFYVLQPVEYIEAVAAPGATAPVGFAAARLGAAAPAGRT
ncbi:hypothetical protein GCM10022407_17560 [Hymenobacter antarcticus]|uniref:Uncharacterized protein n=1 Tax=Hymenobacter antarcticus TaxID=486270 RepID=A0ABP7PVX3_9BACT